MNRFNEGLEVLHYDETLETVPHSAPEVIINEADLEVVEQSPQSTTVNLGSTEKNQGREWINGLTPKAFWSGIIFVLIVVIGVAVAVPVALLKSRWHH